MRIPQWFVGLTATAAIAGAVASGFGCSSKNSPSGVDSGLDGASSDFDSFVCAPQPLGSIPDGGIFAPGCGACVNAMCMAQVAACSADCTCGSQLNMVNTCLAGLPPQEGGAAGGIAGLLSGGTGALTCLLPLASGGGGIAGLLGGGGGGLAGLVGGGGAATEGGAAPDDAAPAGGALGGVLTCLLTTCSCFGSLTMEGGAPEAGGGTGDSSSPEAASADAPGEAASADGSSEAAAQ